MATTKETKTDVFNTLNSIDVGDHIEKKNGLSYLSWAWAWAEVKKRYPDAFYTIYENANGFFYHTDGRTCWVKTGVTINNLEMIEYLPVMDFKNKSIPLNAVTSFDVNKAVQRSLTKAIARHGLGLYIYAGEDLPEDGNAAEATRPVPKSNNDSKKIGIEAAGNLLKKLDKEKILPDTIFQLYGVTNLSDLTWTQTAHIETNIDKIKARQGGTK